MKKKFIISMNFTYASHSGGAIDVAKNLIAGLRQVSADRLDVIHPKFKTDNRVFRVALRYLSDAMLCISSYFKKGTIVFPNYFFLPLPGSRCRKVVIVHDLMFKHYPQYVSWAKRLVLDTNYRWVKKYSDGVVFISRDSRDDFFQRYGEPKRHAVIYNPVVLQGASPDTIRTVGPKSAPYIISNFHYYPHKNIEELLSTFSSINKEWPELQLIFTGNKPPQFDSMIAGNAAAAQIHHLGFLPKEQVMALIRDAACFMSMSQFEGFNMSAAEAALLGKPLVLSELPAHKELFSDCAVFVPLTAEKVNVATVIEFVKSYRPKSPVISDQVKPEFVAQRYLEFIDAVEAS